MEEIVIVDIETGGAAGRSEFDAYPEDFYSWEDCEGGGAECNFSSHEEAYQDAIDSVEAGYEEVKARPRDGRGWVKRGIQHFRKDVSSEEGYLEIEEDWKCFVFAAPGEGVNGNDSH